MTAGLPDWVTRNSRWRLAIYGLMYGDPTPLAELLAYRDDETILQPHAAFLAYLLREGNVLPFKLVVRQMRSKAESARGRPLRKRAFTNALLADLVESGILSDPITRLHFADALFAGLDSGKHVGRCERYCLNKKGTSSVITIETEFKILLRSNTGGRFPKDSTYRDFWIATHIANIMHSNAVSRAQAIKSCSENQVKTLEAILKNKRLCDWAAATIESRNLLKAVPFLADYALRKLAFPHGLDKTPATENANLK